MFRRYFLIVFSLVVVLGFLRGDTASAAGKKVEPFLGTGEFCTCFCATENGAVLAFDDKDLGKNNWPLSICEKKCKEDGHQVAVCAKSPDKFPSNNRLCFTKKACEFQKGDWDGKDSKKQPPECPKGMFYCYPKVDAAEAKLNVKIGTLEKVGDLSIYINAVYGWMLAAGIIIAIVMIMVGGLQRVFSAGMQGMSDGKERIKHAVIGLLLLFSVALIAGTVNPQLLKMQVPRLSKIRQVDIAQGKSCEDYEEDNYITDQGGHEITYELQKCGTQAIVGESRDPNKATVIGQTCQYTGCPDDDAPLGIDRQKCIGVGAKARCVRCKELTDKNTFGIKPSAEVCSQFTIGEITPGSMTFDRCIWTKDGDATNEYGIIKFDSPGSCIYMRIRCSPYINECSDYDTEEGVNMFNEVMGSQPLEDIDTDPYNNTQCHKLIGGCSNASLRTICEENPCKIDGGCKAALDGHDCVPK